MARLNEPPAVLAAPTATQPVPENVDALIREKPPADFEEVKRRFIRQNRELARNNSNQSLRIRSLELDVSRLLAENLELRNQVLHLQNELYSAQSQASTAAVVRVKQELQAKIAELSGIVDGIEDVQDHVNNAAKERRPIEGNWRERQPLSELMRDSQMPTIVENKLFPRRTLDETEIQTIRLSDQSSNESPDLGPPPVARLDYTDPVKQASPLANKVSPDTAVAGEDEELSARFSVNLETRRKRKDGQPKLEIRRHSLLAQSPGKNDDTSSILRTGAKRKLADRETDKPIKPPSKGDFTFSRKVTAEETKFPADMASVPNEVSKLVTASSERPSSPVKPTRKVLGDKSVNMSPRKPSTKDDKSEKDSLDMSRLKDSTSTRRRRSSAIPMPAPQDGMVEIAPPMMELPPQTPAVLDLFSPTPSEPSTLPEPGRGDTPPPGDLSSASLDAAGRPSRRARSAVNYAEPSLISKMRRPDKKMMDAVTGLQDHRRAMSVSGERRISSQSSSIKREPGLEDDSWKTDLPIAATSSPLTQKSGAEDLPSSPPTSLNLPSTSSATMSALIAASRKRRESNQHPAQPLGTDIEVATKKMEELDLYEFKESSSPLSGEIVKPKVRTHRRHSSVPKEREDAVAWKVERAAVGKAERVANRRKSMQL